MDYNHATMFEGVKNVWCDGLGCHWCGRPTRDPLKGHDGFCPVPAMFTLEAEKNILVEHGVTQMKEIGALREYAVHKKDCFQARSARPVSAKRHHPLCSCGLDALLSKDGWLMEAGKELNARIAEEVMGWKVDYKFWTVAKPHGEKPGKFWRVPLTRGEWGAFCPSTRIQDAWLVVEKFFAFSLGSDGLVYLCKLADSPTKNWTIDVGDTAPLAICLAALKAVALP